MTSHSATGANRLLARPLNTLAGYVFGAVFLLVGALGFAVSGDHAFVGEHGGKLLGLFMVNPLHNIVHLGVGAALLLAAYSSEAAARAVNVAVGAVYLLVGVLGLFILDTDMNLLALNSADNVLHLAVALVLLVVGLRKTRATA